MPGKLSRYEHWAGWLAGEPGTGVRALTGSRMPRHHRGISRPRRSSVGLVLFFIGALVTHIRARVFHNIAVPAAYFALAVAAAVLAVSAG